MIAQLYWMTLALLLLPALTIANHYELSELYENQTAVEKQEELWGIMAAEKGNSASYPNFFQLASFLCCEDVEPTMEHLSDRLPYDHGKRIHSVGGVAKATWTSVGEHNYTGLFQGETNAMVRLSLATAPSRSGTTPGIAVKLFRDGLPSANFVAMNSLSGQKSGNFFQEVFSNHIDAPEGSTALTSLANKFEEASSPATMVGLSDMALYNQTGFPVNETEVKFPYQLNLVPNEIISENFKNRRPTSSLERMMLTIPTGAKIYDVFAISDPESTSEEQLKIAELTTDSPIYFTLTGDNFLFFRHQKMEDDVALRPEWEGAVFGDDGDSDGSGRRRRLGCPYLRGQMS